MPKFSIEALSPDLKTRSRHRLSTVSQNYTIILAAQDFANPTDAWRLRLTKILALGRPQENACIAG